MERAKRYAEDGVKKVTLEPDGRAALFATTAFRDGPPAAASRALPRPLFRIARRLSS
jgi:hypothetical protein